MPANHGPFKFLKTDRIGAAGAEDDKDFLEKCFVDTGSLGILTDPADNRIIVLGRTGTGKTALLMEMKRKLGDAVIVLKPDELALTYVANSTVLNFFAGLGVNLDPFFKLLWRHVLTIEILSRLFQQYGGGQPKSLIDWLRGFFQGSSREEKEKVQALDYLEKWGKGFWLETEYRVKEITSKVERELNDQVKSSLGMDFAQLSGSTQESTKLTDSQRCELISRGQEIISKAQVQDLQKVFDLLGSVLERRQRSYFITIDSLDENWVEERLRYRLIMALIQTAREFIRVPNAKIVVALRRDLLERVFRVTRDAGFQEEKYQSLLLPLKWTRSEILDVLETRVRELIARRYTKHKVSYRDVLPREINGVAISDYVFEVADRPRAVIAFFNSCILAAAEHQKLTVTQLGLAMGEFSRQRLRAIADEWSADYPLLQDFAGILKRRPASFKLATVSDVDIQDLCLDIVAAQPESSGLLVESAKAVVDMTLAPTEFKYTLFHVFYKVGYVGLKTSCLESASWTDEFGRAVAKSQISDDTSVVVGHAYMRALGIDDRTYGDSN